MINARAGVGRNINVAAASRFAMINAYLRCCLRRFSLRRTVCTTRSSLLGAEHLGISVRERFSVYKKAFRNNYSGAYDFLFKDFLNCSTRFCRKKAPRFSGFIISSCSGAIPNSSAVMPATRIAVSQPGIT